MSTACWQYEVKKKKALTEPRIYVDKTVKPAIAKLDYASAKAFIVEFEWLGTMGSSVSVYGLTYGPYLAAVVCFARHTSRTAFVNIGIPPEQVFQLSRGASTHWAPKNCSSMLVSRALRLLHAERGATLVVAYADPEAGEIGTIYQAANAIYLGLTDSRGPGRYVINGKAYHPRTVHRAFGCARHQELVKIDPQYTRQQRTKKHKYVFLLGEPRSRIDLSKRILALRQPFPKREAI